MWRTFASVQNKSIDLDEPLSGLTDVPVCDELYPEERKQWDCIPGDFIF